MRKILGGLALLMMASGGASAQQAVPLSTGALAALCAATEAAPSAYCRGFLIAAGQYHSALTAAPGGRAPVFCLPTPGPSVADAQAGFAAWARANPQHAEDRAVDGAMRWAAEAFPCSARAGGR